MKVYLVEFLNDQSFKQMRTHFKIYKLRKSAVDAVRKWEKRSPDNIAVFTEQSIIG